MIQYLKGLSVKKKIAIVLISSFIIDIIVASLVNNACDDRYWLIIMQNTETGNGPYGLDGNFYTPIWGYLLSAYSMFLKFTCSVTGWSAFFPGIDWVPLQPTPWMNIMIKLPLIIDDIVVGFLIYRLIKRHTKNDDKAIIAMCMWCFCPIVIYMSAVQGQFDMLSVLFLLVCIFLLYDDRTFLAGMIFTIALFLKIIPGSCILIFIGYLCIKHKNDDLALKKILASAAGSIIMAAILFIPIIVNGELAQAFGFLSDRADNGSVIDTICKVILIIGAVVLMSIYCRKIVKEKEDPDLSLLLYSGIMIIATNMIVAGFQYIPTAIVSVIMFLFLSRDSRGYKNIYILMTVSALLEGILYMGTYGLVMMSQFYGFIDISAATQTLNVPVIGPITTAALAGLVRAVAVIIMFIFTLMDTNDCERTWICRCINRLRSRGGEA